MTDVFSSVDAARAWADSLKPCSGPYIGISVLAEPALAANCSGHFQPGSVLTKPLPATQNARQASASADTPPSVTTAHPSPTPPSPPHAQRLHAQRRRIGVKALVVDGVVQRLAHGRVHGQVIGVLAQPHQAGVAKQPVEILVAGLGVAARRVGNAMRRFDGGAECVHWNAFACGMSAFGRPCGAHDAASLCACPAAMAFWLVLMIEPRAAMPPSMVTTVPVM